MAFRFRMVPDTTNINFFKTSRMRFWLAISIIGMLVSIGSFVTRGFNYGVDFRGGTIMMVATQQDVPVGDFRSVLDKLNFGEVGVTEISDDSGQGRHMMLLRLGIAGDDPDSQQQVITEVQSTLQKDFPGIQ